MPGDSTAHRRGPIIRHRSGRIGEERENTGPARNAGMTRILVYSFATAMDVVLASVLFVCTVRTAEMQASATAVAAFIPAWAVPYMLTSLLAGQMVRPRNAAWIIIAACLGTAMLACGFILLSGTTAMYVLTALQGVATGLFFTPFQVFMKLVDTGQNRGICHSTGTYTFAWSVGYALGPFIAGFLSAAVGWWSCHAVNGILSVAMAFGTLRLRHHAHRRPPPAATASAAATAGGPIDYGPMPDLAWMAWAFGGAGCVAVSVIRAAFPTSAFACGISKPEQGIILFILSASQALTGLALSRSRWWMYRPGPVLAFGAAGATGLAMIAFAERPWQFGLGAACFGVYSGSFFFYFVFHSLVHPSRSGAYVSINEAIVGLTSVIGPFAAGFLADHRGLNTPYWAALGLIASAIAVQAAIHGRKLRTHPPRVSP